MWLGCKKKRTLPFDFAVFENGEIKFMIEYNGKQHYESVDFFGGKAGYEDRVEKDNIKKDFCLKKNIPLLIIDYNENIEEKINTMTILSQA